MSSRGIKSFGAYIPSLRLERKTIAAAHDWALPALRSRAKGERSFANWDEDAITMGVEAARSTAVDAVGNILFASTTAPFADLQSSSHVAGALNLPPGVGALDIGGSQRAGTSALITAIGSMSDRDSLVIAADSRKAKPGSAQEMDYGAGAVAMTVGAGDVIARLLGWFTRCDQFVDHFRAIDDRYDYAWEERWIRDEGYLKIVPDAVREVFRATGVDPSIINHFCMPGFLPGIALALAKELSINPDAIVDNLATRCGDTGVPQPLLMMSYALETAKPGDKLLLVGFGGGCDVLLFEATEALQGYKSRTPVSQTLAAQRLPTNYLKLLSFHGEISLDWGMRSEVDEKTSLSQQYRAREQLYGFIGGHCVQCGVVQFPVLGSCVNCGSFVPMLPHRLADEAATLASYTFDNLQYYPDPPLHFGFAHFTSGARVLMELVDVDSGTLSVGSALRMVYRIKNIDSKRHYKRYFWKATRAL